MRRTHLRGHTNILKRVLIHAGGFNLGLVMRQLIGLGTPRGLQGRVAAVIATLLMLVGAAKRRVAAMRGRLAITDYARCQLVSGGGLYHGLLWFVAEKGKRPA